MSIQNRQVISDDWRRNWQQSIAVRISGVVLWVIVPLVFGVALVLLQNLERELNQQLSVRADMLAHRIVMELAARQQPVLADILPNLEMLLAEMEFDGIQLRLGDQQVQAGKLLDDAAVLTRVSTLSSHGHQTDHSHQTGAAHGDVLTLLVYHEPVEQAAREKRGGIVIVMTLTLLGFGMFLIWAIRTIVHKPLQALVGATRAVSFGDTSIRLKADGSDEFSYIARFFNEMLHELQENQNALEQAAQEARQASRAKSIFLANMSHELRTPLNAIIGYGEMLEEDLREHGLEQDVSDIVKVQDAARHLLEIINNILDVSKIEAGKVEVYAENFDVVDLIDEVVGTMQPMVHKRRNRLVMEYDEAALGSMYSDQTKIRQILLNLLSNASKFTENGRITLHVSREQLDGQEYCHFRITDTGIGITGDQMGLLFHAFSQADLSTTRKYGGTGLGLVICKYYCELLGGTISLHSEPDRGTEFRVVLPAEASRAQGDSEQRKYA